MNTAIARRVAKQVYHAKSLTLMEWMFRLSVDILLAVVTIILVTGLLSHFIPQLLNSAKRAESDFMLTSARVDWITLSAHDGSIIMDDKENDVCWTVAQQNYSHPERDDKACRVETNQLTILVKNKQQQELGYTYVFKQSMPLSPIKTVRLPYVKADQ
ncbi:hypothetical protein [Pleionea litopenaei]|uniref:Uncharacterized protein n=1 Tax=Pleionea litopenaei TaxID=3070815 RepID=A0AA51RW79_9GAMM|nr:hypothetical protein [Pleionea sp. HL-JVS1]WMS88722.1 hypothetical protein Q9312_07345 [Pleionea sp. HL-JVS1]